MYKSLLNEATLALLQDPQGAPDADALEALVYSGYGTSPEWAAIDEAFGESCEGEGFDTEMSYILEEVVAHLGEVHATHPVQATAAQVEAMVYRELPQGAFAAGYTRADMCHLHGFWVYLERVFGGPEIAAARRVCARALAAFEAGDPRLPRAPDEVSFEGDSGW